MSILRDRNYRQNAIVIPKNLNQIIELDYWARNKTFLLYENFMLKNLLFIFTVLFSSLSANEVKDISYLEMKESQKKLF